jgi:hypothetical protein
MLVLLIEGFSGAAVEINLCDMIYVPSFLKIGTGVASEI